MDPEARKLLQRKRRRRWLVLLLAIFFCGLIALYVAVQWSGRWLLLDQPVEKVRYAVILDGQSADMERSDYAVQLLLEAKADTVILLGRRTLRDRNLAEFYFDDMMRQGQVDASRIYLLKHNDDSSLEEAYSIVPILKQRGADTVLLVTQNAATRRIFNIFSKVAGSSPVFKTVVIPDPWYEPDSWIHNRSSRKIWLREWAAMLASWWDLLWVEVAEPVPGKTYPMQWQGSAKKIHQELVPIVSFAESSSSLSASSSSDSTLSSSSSQEPLLSSSSAAVAKAVTPPAPKVEKPTAKSKVAAEPESKQKGKAVSKSSAAKASPKKSKTPSSDSRSKPKKG